LPVFFAKTHHYLSRQSQRASSLELEPSHRARAVPFTHRFLHWCLFVEVGNSQLTEL
jgi:hypothetical protein